MDRDVRVVASEPLKVVGVGGRDDAAAESDRGGDDRRVDRVAGVEVISCSKASRDASGRVVERDDPVPSSYDAIDLGVGPASPVHLHQDRGRDTHESASPLGLVEQRLRSSRRHGPVTSVRQSVDGFTI